MSASLARTAVRSIALRYALFAALATLANLVAQRLVLLVHGDAGGLVAAIGVGTAVGLVVKYALDKQWIFADRRGGVAGHSQLFTLYAATGVVTTAVFWGAEAGAWTIWRTDLAREAGAVAGLAIGYALKYQLDARFVFAQPREGAA